jgi:hypothetical protein
MPIGDRPDPFARSVAYSTGLRVGQLLGEILSALMRPLASKGDRMSTAKADVLELLEDVPENEDSGETGRTLARITLAKDYPHPTRELSGAEAELWEALQEIAAPTAKDEILAALDPLPDECTMEDILEELDEREHLRQGLASAIYEPRISQDEVEAWVEQWAREHPAETTIGEAGTTISREELPRDREQVGDTLDYAMSTSKDEVLEVLRDLPDDCSLDDILHTLYVRIQIKQGIWSLDNEPTFTQEEVEQSLSRWLTN